MMHECYGYGIHAGPPAEVPRPVDRINDPAEIRRRKICEPMRICELFLNENRVAGILGGHLFEDCTLAGVVGLGHR